jgi:hypothetical protein
MGQKSSPVKEPAEQVVKQIRRFTRRQLSAEENIRIVLSGLPPPTSTAGAASYFGRTTKDQTTGRCQPSTAAPPAGRLISPNRCARASLLSGPVSQKL